VSAVNPYDKMLENVVYTASKEELTLMLYEGAIKFCNQAIINMEKNEHEKSNQFIQRVQDIINEFQMTLDKRYEISAQFNDLYDYMYNRLAEVYVNKDVSILNEVLDLLRNFRNAWKEGMVQAKKEKLTHQAKPLPSGFSL
jgi:flagellar protein FliS